MAKLTQLDRPEHGPDYIFYCPGCQCSHGVWTLERATKPRWEFNGDMDKPTFSPSLNVNMGDLGRCHSFVKNGFIQFLGDCTHELKGQTVKIPDTE